LRDFPPFVKDTLRRKLLNQVRYSGLNPQSDLSHIHLHFETLLSQTLFAPLARSLLLEEQPDLSQFLENYIGKAKAAIEAMKQKKRKGLAQFLILMSHSEFKDLLTEEELKQMWVSTVGGSDDISDPIESPN
jgi:hypothetical protein